MEIFSLAGTSLFSPAFAWGIAGDKLTRVWSLIHTISNRFIIRINSSKVIIEVIIVLITVIRPISVMLSSEPEFVLPVSSNSLSSNSLLLFKFSKALRFHELSFLFLGLLLH